MDLKIKAQKIAKILSDWFPNQIHTPLVYRNPFELLVATILSAQCTDKKVNSITPALFSAFPDPYKMSSATEEEISKYIRPTGFFRAKAKAIKSCAKVIIEKFGGNVPNTMEELSSLPGVGRKTANVVLTNCFGRPGVVVDRHVLRVVQRIGLTEENEPEKVEAVLMELLPEEEWASFSHRLTWFGRQICLARAPKCSDCRLLSECQYGQSL